MEREVEPNLVYTQYVSSYLARRGMMLKQYAQLVGADLRTVEKWMNGETRCPQVMQWVRLCKIHGVDFDRYEDMGFTPRTSRRLTTLRRHLGPGTEDKDVVNLIRRDLLGVSAGVFYSAVLTGPVARMLESLPAAEVDVGASDVDRLAEANRHIKLSGNMMGSGVLGQKTLLREYTRAGGLLKGSFASDEVRMRAHAVVASLTRTIGWNLFDFGLHDEARRLWIASLAIARDADPSVSLVIHAHTFENLAYQAIALGHPQEALDLLAMFSGRERNLPMRMRANISSIRAQATAALGDVEETRRHIDWAQDHVNDPVDERDVEWWNETGHFNESEMNGNATHALTTLAVTHGYRRDDALGTADRSLRNFPAEHSVAKARVQTTLARLHAANRDPAETEKALGAAVQTARRLRSPRVNGELMGVRPYLSPWRRQAAFGDLDQEIVRLNKSLN